MTGLRGCVRRSDPLNLIRVMPAKGQDIMANPHPIAGPSRPARSGGRYGRANRFRRVS